MKRLEDAIYLGFASHGNLGDDVIRDAIYSATPDVRFYETPVRRKDLVRELGSPVRLLSRRGLPLLLGGGTVLGRDTWRRHFSNIERIYAPSRWFMIGAGVEDPEFSGDARYTSAQEFARWAAIWERFPTLTVRGPRSAEILAEFGLTAEIVGDPALLIESTAWDAEETVLDVLVNVTAGEDQWGGKALDWTQEVSALIEMLERDGLRIGFLSMESTDDEWVGRLMGRLGRTYPVSRPTDLPALLDLLRSTRVLVGTRLHANIPAAAIGTPAVSLEYRPKCRDFMRSIAQERFCFRVDRLDRSELHGSVSYLLDHGPEISAAIEDRVVPLRDRLRQEVRSIRAGL